MYIGSLGINLKHENTKKVEEGRGKEEGGRRKV
jgi:hypothetical protein